MAVLLGRNGEEIAGELLVEVANNTGLTQVSPGAKVRSLLEAVSKQVGDFYVRMDLDLAQAFLPGAGNEYLDFIGDMLGMPRLGRESVSINANHRNLKFYVESGTFGEINDGVSILLPANTRIGTASAGSGTIYKLPHSVLLSSTDSEIYVPAEAVQPGESGNVGANTLKYHDFVNYAGAANETLLVTNEAEIQSGREPESDTNYRFRLSNAVVANEGANPVAIRLAILSVAGVADVVMQPYYRGIGSFDVVIKSVSPICPTSLLLAVQDEISSTAAQGVFFMVRRPLETGVSMHFNIKLTTAITDTDQDRMVEQLQKSIADYINNLDIGEELIINELIRIILSSDDRIKDVGTTSKPIESLYIYKETNLEDNKIRSTLTENYVPSIHERVIVETEHVTGDPISVGIEI